MPTPQPSLESQVQDLRKKDRPPTLHISDSNSVSNDDAQLQRRVGNVNTITQQIPQHGRHSSAKEELSDDVPSRSDSATSSLDPYYFGLQSPSDSPTLPPLEPKSLRATPETYSTDNPASPTRDVASIDRRGLVGVGELATPRWANSREDVLETTRSDDDGVEDYEVVIADGMEKDGSDSPWTIEAIDGDSDEAIEIKPVHHPLRTRPSIAEESGGEEILYPRSSNLAMHTKPSQPHELLDEQSSPSATLNPGVTTLRSPPSAFSAQGHRARKRTSDEFEIDQSGVLVSKRSGPPSGHPRDKGRDDKASVRKHRSLNANHSHGASRDKGREHRKDIVSSNVPNHVDTFSTPGQGYDGHAKRISTSSSSSSHGEILQGRWTHIANLSQLPPSPSTSSIQPFLRQTGKGVSLNTPPQEHSREPQAPNSSNVAHSLLRGTQEGWSGLDDEATAEALRKLDGLVGKTARARASVSSFGKPASLSRSGTPPGRLSAQWEGVSTVENQKVLRRSSARDNAHSTEKESNDQTRQRIGLGLSSGDTHVTRCEPDTNTIESGDDLPQGPAVEKTPKKIVTSIRTSLTPKRASGSSTLYASTPSTTSSSRDSASISTTTSMTSVSAVSGRHLISRTSRNSAGSDVLNMHAGDAATTKDRPPSLALTSDPLDDGSVPPVPPLPKELSTYKSATTSVGLTFPSLGNSEERRGSQDSDQDRTFSLEVPSFARSMQGTTSQSESNRQSQHRASNSTSIYTPPDSAPAVLKTPSKKWSFSALNIKLSGSPSSSKSSLLPMSPRAISFGQQLRRSTSKDHDFSPSGVSKNIWSMARQDAMSSAASLVSSSSKGSARKSPNLAPSSKTPECGVGSHSGTDSSASTSQPAVLVPQHTPLSPSSSIRRGHSSRRLTPSSIPFFRRSSSQSIQLQPSSSTATPLSPTLSPAPISQSRSKTNISPQRNSGVSSSSTPASAQKKSSVLSLGFPAILKGSSSRRSLQADKSDSNKTSKDIQSSKAAEKEAEKAEKERQKKEDKDRSESRISVLIGRKRGKTLSSTDPKKAKPQVNLPPIQMSALPSVTAHRVASLKSSSISTPSVSSATARSTTSSRVTAQTVSSMQKQSDPALRSRNQLPTIAGSPSVGTQTSPATKEVLRDHLPSLLNASALADRPKETPTKIPRIASRTSAIGTPPPKISDDAGNRSSTHVTTMTVHSTEPSPIPGGLSIDEFGVVDYGDSQVFSSAVGHTSQRQNPARKSPSSSSRVPRQSTTTTILTSGNSLQRKANRESLSFTGFRKSSTGSVASIVSVVPSEAQHRLSPSKLLSPKMSLPTTRVSELGSSQYSNHMITSPSTSRQSLSTPSPVPGSVDEEEFLGDEEMVHYIRRQQAKKIANGATQEELDELLRFPEPLPPGSPSTPASILKGSQAQHLSECEKKEILDYPSVYYFGAKGKKKMSTLDNSSSNYGYDDDRGDYVVFNHDHLAYRYEIIDTLGKGSFGQVLHCRDHCTGESMAVKIIRNKKRFHHQALVEIKILDNLRKWDVEEKHHVIKMTEHFYFRNHLCIAMELLSINLYELIKANGFVGFTTTLIRRFTSQMLSSLALMRHHRIVHCDLKPENVLLRHPAKSALKVIDFGSSCFEHEKIYTYIQSRFYRSPEVILGMNYHMAIDMWSLGCILAELYTGFPIFPGENEQEQLSCIMEVLGVPDRDFINRSSRKRLFFDSNGGPRPVVNSKGRRRRPGTKTLAQALRCNDEDFVDFIAKCLVWDPERRMKPQAAMRHPFITASRRSKVVNNSTTTKSLLSSTTLSGNRSKQMFETPKKSQISAPTPLTARSFRTSNIAPPTPHSSSVHSTTIVSSSRSYRSSQPHNFSSYHSSRTLNGLTTTVGK